MKTLFKPKLVMIDVDGTLVDSVPDLAWCVDETMKAIGLPVRGESIVRQWVGNGVIRLMERAIANDLDAKHDQALFEKGMPIFNALYADNNAKRSGLYAGVKDGLAYLKSLDLKVGCVTNKDQRFTLPILTDLGIVDEFEIIISGDTLEKKKPDPLPLLYAAEQLGVDPKQSLMLGDSQSDVKAARAADFAIICMSYGYNHGEDIHNYHPDAVIDSMTALRDMLK